MSRIGYKEIDLPEGVEISQQGNIVTVKGPKGTLSREISPLIKMSVEGNVVKFIVMKIATKLRWFTEQPVQTSTTWLKVLLMDLVRP